VHLEDGLVGGMSLATLGALRTNRVAGRHAPWLGTEVAAETLVQEGTSPALALFGWSLLRAGATVRALDAYLICVARSDGTVLELRLPWPSPKIARDSRSRV
jgi:hypothetical protein